MPEKRQSAFIRATKEAQAGTATTPTTPTGTTVTPLEGSTVTKQDTPTTQGEGSKKAKKDQKVTVYLTKEQEDKLDGLEFEFYQRHKRKVNRIEIIRYLIDQCDIDNLQGL